MQCHEQVYVQVCTQRQQIVQLVFTTPISSLYSKYINKSALFMRNDQEWK